MAHDESLNPGEGPVAAGLEDAARLYMDGQYQAALAAWEQVLAVDPENLRAREGIKKTQMLLAGDGPMPPAPTEPILLEIASLFETRRFDEVVAACRAGVETAGPALRPTLHELQQRAERARAVEPEIQSHIESARRLLREGNSREALPHLKQVLTLDRDHPAAARLMQAIRDRVQKRARPELPASGAPGSDAPPEGAPSRAPTHAAPLGQGLPSSPVFAPSGEAVAEIEFEGLAMEPEPETPTEDVGESASSFSMAGMSEEPEDQAVESAHSEFAFEEIADPVGAGAGVESDFRTESPFQDTEAQATVRLDRSDLDAPAARPAPPASRLRDDEEPSPASLGRSHSSRSGLATSFPTPPPAVRGGSSGRSWRGIVLAAVAAVALGGVVWLDPLGLFFSDADAPGPTPTADAGSAPSEAPRAAPRANAAARPDAPEGAIGTDARAALLLFEEGQDHFEADRLEAALIAFKQAAAKDPAQSEIQSWMERTEARLEERRRDGAEHELATQAFRDKEFDGALRRFYRLQEQNPDGPYARYIANAWYNWGLQLLAAGNLKEAINRFEEGLAVRADDDEAQAVRDLAASYLDRAKDPGYYQRLEALRYRALED